MQLSEQEKKFPEFFCAILISTINFEHFQNEIDPHSWYISELRTLKNVVKQFSKKSRVRGPFDKQHGKGDETMLKPERHQLYHIFR